MATTLGAAAIGTITKIRENGVLTDFVVIAHGYPASGRSLLRRREQCMTDTVAYSTNEKNKYEGSTLDGWYENTYFGRLEVAVSKYITPVAIQCFSGGRYWGDLYSISRRVFALSATELNFDGLHINEDGYTNQFKPGDGSVIPYFNSRLKWAAQTPEGDNNGFVYTRSPYRSTGDSSNDWCAYFIRTGIRYAYPHLMEGAYVLSQGHPMPSFTLPDTLHVGDGGAVTDNAPPSSPTSINVPSTVKGGASLAISWGGSSDPDGNLSGYRLERSVNNGGYGQIYQGGATLHTDSITYGWGSVAYRVKAYDALGGESGYVTSPTRTVVNNSTPAAPASISVPATVRGGKSCNVSWGAATDVDGNLTGYKLERSVNSGGYTQIYAGTARSFTDTITRGWVSVIYRVRAYDAENAHSGYTTAPSRTIVNNLAPVISGADGDLGVKTAAFTQTYSVTDDDGDPITVTEKLDAAILRTYTATAGATNTLTIDAGRFMRILNGRRTISATAKDNQGGTATRTWTFTKSVTKLSVTLSTPLPADAAVTKCVLNVVREIPLGADFTVEVCNNAFDPSPTWEDATAAVLSGRKYFIANTTKTAASWGFNLLIAVDRKNTVGDCYIAGIGGAFA